MKKNIKKIRSHKKGETLVEVIIAVVVVAIGSGVATTLIVTALVSNSFNRDNLIAMNLATEGIEAVRSIRDTNWIKFSYDKTNCWNVQPRIDPTLPEYQPVCTAEQRIQPNYYQINLRPGDYVWRFDSVSQPLDLHTASLTNEDYRIHFNDVSPGVDTDGDGDPDNDHDLYTSRESTTEAEITGDSIFYRMVTIEYDDPLPENATEMRVTSLVQWKAGNAVHQVKVRSILTNYQKVSVT
jgi:type II secretory pathway pseudopilin PulG